MKAVNFQILWLMLGVAAIPVIFIERLPIPASIQGPVFLYSLVGALYALALVVSLSSGPKWLWRFAFVLVTAILSVLVPFVGLLVAGLAGDLGDFSILLALVLASVTGASTYWLLVRWTLIGNLRYLSLGLAVMFCGLATTIGFLAGIALTNYGQYSEGVRRMVADAIPTIAWWFAFSLALYLDLGLEDANKSLKSDAVNGAA